MKRRALPYAISSSVIDELLRRKRQEENGKGRFELMSSY
jgi:hypothetical protein